MTEKTWKEKWMANYRGEGDCQELETFLKELDYGSRKGVTYLPWAVVDRIFKMQDGVTETNILSLKLLKFQMEKKELKPFK